MYIPAKYRSQDLTSILSFIKSYSFGTIISNDDKRPIATHLPFAVQENQGDIILASHFARANPQWKELDSKEVLCIFSEPHAYISPRHYDKRESVPTWNYVAVHAYGNVQILNDEEKAFEILEEMICYYESDYLFQWENLPKDFKLKMLKGIVAFRITVHELQCQEKLSQNKNENEHQRIIESLSLSEHDHERKIAELMQDKLSQN